ncbi:PhoH family protein [Arthrobacter sp. TMT4-20]
MTDSSVGISAVGLDTKVVHFDSTEQMVQALGTNDEALRLIESTFVGVNLHVRGNELSITGPAVDVARTERLISEIRTLAANNTTVNPQVLKQLVSMLKDQSVSSPSDVLTMNILSSRGRTIRPKTLNQRDYVEAIDRHTVVFGIGPAGTGKTYLAMAKAVQALQHKEVNRIILTRPAVEAGERLGFLPGTLSDKIDPYLRPLYDALHDMMDPDSIPRLMAAGTIEVAPLAYMRGRTLNDAFIILDEAQNTTPEQMKMFLTRLGFGSKMVVTGDVTQVDLPGGTNSGLRVVSEILQGVQDVSFRTLDASDVVRHRLVGDIVTAYSAWDENQRASAARDHRGPRGHAGAKPAGGKP